MNLIDFFNDYGIPYITEGKNCSPGWININCPFCGDDPSEHLGFNLDDERVNCWRCGWHPLSQTIALLLNISEQQARSIIRQYGGRNYITPPTRESKNKTGMKNLRLPSGATPLLPNHKKYLESRGFDPDRLEKEWTLLGTGPISLLDKESHDFKHRILIPIIWNEQQVSFTSRDITNQHPLRYISCPEQYEIIHHKHIVYGKQSAWKKTGLCVEGPTDVWRLGVNSFATFGIKYTLQQVRVIAKHFNRVFILFDPEDQAQEQARKLRDSLQFRRVKTELISISTDPGSMSQSEADYLVKHLIK